jgi:antitoxin VapB
MTLHIRNPEADQLARKLAARLNSSVTDAVIDALRARLANAEPHPDSVEARLARVREIQERVAALPVLDHRSADEILGYDENGLPT